jgi:hypothetical protein
MMRLLNASFSLRNEPPDAATFLRGVSLALPTDKRIAVQGEDAAVQTEVPGSCGARP